MLRYSEISLGPLNLATPDRHVAAGVLRECENLVPRGSSTVYLQPAENSQLLRSFSNAVGIAVHSRQKRGVLSTVADGSLERFVIVTTSNIQIYDEGKGTVTTAHSFATTDATRKAQFAQIGDKMFIAVSTGADVGAAEDLLILEDDVVYDISIPEIDAVNIPFSGFGTSSIEAGDSYDSMLRIGMYAIRHAYVLADGSCVGITPPRIVDLRNRVANPVLLNPVVVLKAGVSQGDTTFTVENALGTPIPAVELGEELSYAKSKGFSDTILWIDGEKVEINDFNIGTGVGTLKSGTQFLKDHALGSNVLIEGGYQLGMTLNNWPNTAPWDDLVVGAKIFMTARINSSDEAYSTSYHEVGTIQRSSDVLSNSFSMTSSEESILEGPILDDTNLANYNPIAASVSSYNKRLVLGDVAYDYPLPMVSLTASGSTYNFRFGVIIKTVNGDIERISDVYQTDVTNPVFTNGLFSYPDRRAYKLVVYMDDGTAVYRKADEYDLRVGSTVNAAYYQFESTATYSVTGADPVMPNVTTANAQLDLDRNRVIVSDVNRALELPAGSAYYVGNTADDTVVAFAANTSPISEGQFGTYPFYVLCRNTVWAFQTDSTGVFQSLQPVETFRGCLSRYGVVNAGRFVFFASDDGIWTLPVSNYPISQALHIRDTGGFVEMLDKDTSLGYFNDGKVGRRELWVSAGGQVWGFSLDHKRWFTLTRDRFCFRDFESVLYSVDSSGLNRENNGSGDVAVSLKTAPLHLGRYVGDRHKYRRVGFRLDSPENFTFRIKEGENTLYEGEVTPEYYSEPVAMPMMHVRQPTLEIEGTISTTTQIDGFDIEQSIHQRSGARVY